MAKKCDICGYELTNPIEEETFNAYGCGRAMKIVSSSIFNSQEIRYCHNELSIWIPPSAFNNHEVEAEAMKQFYIDSKTKKK